MIHHAIPLQAGMGVGILTLFMAIPFAVLPFIFSLFMFFRKEMNKEADYNYDIQPIEYTFQEKTIKIVKMLLLVLGKSFMVAVIGFTILISLLMLLIDGDID